MQFFSHLIYLCLDWFSPSPRGKNMKRPISGLTPIYQSCVTFLRKPWCDLCRHGKSVRPIPVLRWGWWVIFQHGRLSWAPPSWILNSPPDWLKFVAAILDLENNRVYCSRNNSLLSFSAPDWLLLIWARYSSNTVAVSKVLKNDHQS